MDWDRRTRIGARAPGVERQKPFARRCFSAPRSPAQNGDQTRAAGSTKDKGKPIDVRAASYGKALSDTPALKPYWGKPAVRNFREGNGNVGIMRSPLRAIALPDQSLEIHVDEYGVYRDLTRSRAILATIWKLVFWSSDVPNF